MLIVRYHKDNQIQFGHLEDEKVGPLANDPFGGEVVRGPLKWSVAEVGFLAPCQPSKTLPHHIYGSANKARDAPTCPPCF
jgi:hypothetical protein